MVGHNRCTVVSLLLLLGLSIPGLLLLPVHAGAPVPVAGTITTVFPDGQLVQPSSVAVDKAGNLYVADSGNYVVRKLDTHGKMSIVAGMEGRIEKYEKLSTEAKNQGKLDKRCTSTTGDFCKATEALFTLPYGVALDAKGNLYVSDSRASKIRKVDTNTGIITVYAGTGESGWDATKLYNPEGMAFDAQGNLYVADRKNNAIRKITAPANPKRRGTITTVAGLGPEAAGCTPSAAVLPASDARLKEPQDVVVDDHGNIYIADTGCRKIRKIGTDGVMRTVVGSGHGHGGPPLAVPWNGPAKALEINLGVPVGVNVDAAGNLYISDSGFGVVWFYEAATGQVRVLAGLPGPESAGHTICKEHTNDFGDGCPGTEAKLNQPYRVALDAQGNVYIPEHGGMDAPMPPFSIRVLHPAK
jgi:DNA-binding beta-propeller fold protein YncE